MARKKRQVATYLDSEAADKLTAIAEADHRTLSNLLSAIILAYLADHDRKSESP